MENIGIISGIVALILIIIFIAYSKKVIKVEEEHKKTGKPIPEIKPDSLSNKVSTLLFFILIIAVVLSMIFLGTGGSPDWLENPKGFAE